MQSARGKAHVHIVANNFDYYLVVSTFVSQNYDFLSLNYSTLLSHKFDFLSYNYDLQAVFIPPSG